MSINVYANLIGRWVNLSNDHNSLIDQRSPDLFYEEMLPELFDHDYVNIIFKGHHYRIHPSYLQFSDEDLD